MSTKVKNGRLTRGFALSDSNLLLAITVFVFFAMYIAAYFLIGGSFEKPNTFCNLLNENAGLIILSCSMSLVMITGGIDISVGMMSALITMSVAVNVDMHGGNIVTAALIALGIGLAYGLVQGYLVAYLDIQPFIVSLAGMFFAKGMTTIVNSNPINIANKDFIAAKDTHILLEGIGYTTKKGKFITAYVEPGVIVALVIVVLLFILLRWTKLGRSFYAVGGNAGSANMLGINVRKTKFLAHLLCSTLAGVGGFIYALHLGSGSVTNGAGAEMNAIASSIIGGTMLTGGVGNIIGTLFGVLSLATIKSIVAALNLTDPWWKDITVAAMICLFLVIQKVVLARKK